MHDALLLEQRRTNQLLETLVILQGGTVPEPLDVDIGAYAEVEYDPGTGMPMNAIAHPDAEVEYDPGTGMPINEVRQ